MDWFSWLSKTNLDASLVYNYAVTFTQNDLEKDDISHFSHEFLQSMGVSVAKHRLEILKLARKEKSGRIHPVSWLVFVIKRTKNYLTDRVQALVRRESSSHLLVPKRNHSLRWKVAMVQRSPRVRAAKLDQWPIPRSPDHKTLMLTSGSPMSLGADSVGSIWTQSSSSVEPEANAGLGHITRGAMANNPSNSSFSSTAIHSADGDYRSGSAEEVKWDSMFKNLKPT